MNRNESGEKINLILTDEINQQQIILKKKILTLHSIYFACAFSNFKEKDAKSITVIVTNVNVSFDVIMFLCGINTNIGNLPRWQHLLESFKCKLFFGISTDPELLADLDVPAAGFELLLEVIELVGYNEHTIWSINKNLPVAYDVSQFPPELINAMLETAILHNIVYTSDVGEVTIWDLETHIEVNTFRGDRFLNLIFLYIVQCKSRLKKLLLL
jgi:hypothetical protein